MIKNLANRNRKMIAAFNLVCGLGIGIAIVKIILKQYYFVVVVVGLVILKIYAHKKFCESHNILFENVKIDPITKEVIEDGTA